MWERINTRGHVVVPIHFTCECFMHKQPMNHVSLIKGQVCISKAKHCTWFWQIPIWCRVNINWVNTNRVNTNWVNTNWVNTNGLLNYSALTYTYANNTRLFNLGCNFHLPLLALKFATTQQPQNRPKLSKNHAVSCYKQLPFTPLPCVQWLSGKSIWLVFGRSWVQ